jgi:hypothetical protein
VNEFVEQCRREWKRLRVPDPIADEMADELAADLEQAHAEGGTQEALLGSAAADPGAFAAAWAAERGVAPSPKRRSRGAVLAAALAILAGIAITGAVLVIVASPSSSRAQVVLPLPPPDQRLAREAQPPVWVAQPRKVVTIQVRSLSRLPESAGSDQDTRTLGLVLLVAGLAGIVPLAVFGRTEHNRA